MASLGGVEPAVYAAWPFRVDLMPHIVTRTGLQGAICRATSVHFQAGQSEVASVVEHVFG